AVDTVCRLKDAYPNVVGIKEAGGDADRVSQLRAALGETFTILSGDAYSLLNLRLPEKEPKVFMKELDTGCVSQGMHCSRTIHVPLLSI
ncbi:dihydrodipicolinate synthase family protein, partial [Verrucomicrobia bacterium]|nr:dihydrodipicolinate synthase family protein [Verrucomicrobiota bacterium]